MSKSNRDNRGGRRKSRPELTEAEWTIMKIVWENQPCAAGTVQDTLQETKNWAYGTVKGAMDRMVEKGFLKVERIRNLQLFSSAISRAQARKGELKKTLKRAFDGALTPMVQFLIENENFSPAQLKQIRKFIQQTERRKRR
jgi:BlaI family penicillinase repressor